MKRFIQFNLICLTAATMLTACGKDKSGGAAPASNNGAQASSPSPAPQPVITPSPSPEPSPSPPASPPAAGLPVLGNWLVADQNIPGIGSIRMVMSVSENSVTISATCNYPDHTASASVTAAAEISASKIKVLESKSDGGADCNASLEPKELSYTATADSLTLTDNGNSQTVHRP